jgi:class 3 adenylate cyclase
VTVVPDEFAQRSRWRAFQDPSVEENYRAWHYDRVLPIAHVVGYSSVVLWALLPVSFELLVGASSEVLRIGSWAIALPTFLGALLLIPRFPRWANEIVTFVNMVSGLDIIWLMSSLYGPLSGPVTCSVLSATFIILIIRVPTRLVAVSTTAQTSVAAALLLNGIQHGDISVFDGWPYLAFLMTNAALVLAMATGVEASMRQQFAAQSQLHASQQLLRRYVPEQVADAVVSNRAGAIDRHERRKLTIFFSDLVGFTDLSEELEPEDLAMVLHDYFTEMSAIAKRHGGTVDDLVGDAILVLFGAPERTDDLDQALRAVRMSVEMQEAMVSLNRRWSSAGIPENLAVRMGINTGVATVGNFGSAERTKYTALGKQVNIAARIQSQCEPGKVLLGHATWLLVGDVIPCASMGELTLKGLHKPMAAYEVL